MHILARFQNLWGRDCHEIGKLPSPDLGWPMRCLWKREMACRLQAEGAPFIQMSQFQSCEVGFLLTWEGIGLDI
jgi:hypothetical protein